jgi:hypothetical protein
MSGMTDHLNSDSDQFISNSLNLALELLNDIFLQISTLEIKQDEQRHFSNLHLTKLSLNLTQFIELTTLTSRMITLKKSMTFNEVKNSHIHLLFVLKGINQAQLKNDEMILEDLIKYELKDNLTQWKINIIPTIKRMLNP